MFNKILTGTIILTMAFGIWGCSKDNNPTSSVPDQSTPLAGGGRLTDNDPAGGHEGSNPGMPDFDSLHGLTPLFSSYIDCANNPGERIITSPSEWEEWWQVANSCSFIQQHEPWPPDSGGWDSVPYDSFPWDSMPHDSFPWDSTIDTTIWPDTGYYGAPPVNFDSFVVVVIALAPDSTSFGRSIWVDEVTTDVGGTVVRYTVSSIGNDCVMLMIYTFDNTSVMAVMAPRPIAETITWIRTDTVFNCNWEPDPNVPVTLYYTSTPCDLGPGETVITDSANFASWWEAAWKCDWPFLFDTGSYSTGWPVWYNPDIDFTTHAIIILRSGDLTSWGGGIWLDKFDVTDGGTIIDYTVMEPGDDCPAVEPPWTTFNPTVAIRVPLPINLPITWNRSIQSIQCNWYDSTVTGGGGN